KESIASFKLASLVKYATYVPGGLYCVSFALVMNEAKWKSISAADQAAINKLAGEALARRAGKAWDAADVKGDKALRDAKVPIVTADAKFVAEIKSKTGGLEQEWINKVKAKGVDGAAVLKAIRDELGKA